MVHISSIQTHSHDSRKKVIYRQVINPNLNKFSDSLLPKPPSSPLPSPPFPPLIHLPLPSPSPLTPPTKTPKHPSPPSPSPPPPSAPRDSSSKPNSHRSSPSQIPPLRARRSGPRRLFRFRALRFGGRFVGRGEGIGGRGLGRTFLWWVGGLVWFVVVFEGWLVGTKGGGGGVSEVCFGWGGREGGGGGEGGRGRCGEERRVEGEGGDALLA